MLRPVVIASITPRHGAYLITLDHSPFSEDTAPSELYDAAGSLTTAKRVAKEQARDGGCTHLKWVPGPVHGYSETVTLLVGVVPDVTPVVY